VKINGIGSVSWKTLKLKLEGQRLVIGSKKDDLVFVFVEFV